MDNIHLLNITELQKARTVVKVQLGKAEKCIDELKDMPKEVVRNKMKTLQDYCTRYEAIQFQIDIKSKEEDLEKEIDYRAEIEEKY